MWASTSSCFARLGAPLSARVCRSSSVRSLSHGTVVGAIASGSCSLALPESYSKEFRLTLLSVACACVRACVTVPARIACSSLDRIASRWPHSRPCISAWSQIPLVGVVGRVVVVVVVVVLLWCYALLSRCGVVPSLGLLSSLSLLIALFFRLSLLSLPILSSPSELAALSTLLSSHRYLLTLARESH
jgi:hypothetical protein